MPSREGGEREHGRLAPQDLRGRDRRQGHRLDLDVGARLIGVDLQEHVTDAQGRALVMGDDDLDLLHVGHYRGDDHRRRRQLSRATDDRLWCRLSVPSMGGLVDAMRDPPPVGSPTLVWVGIGAASDRSRLFTSRPDTSPRSACGS